MKVNLSKTVKNLCSNQNMTLKDLANKMGIASESLSRTLKGNPQLATLENIAKCLNVDVCDLFPSSTDNNAVPLRSIIVYDEVTYISDDLDGLIKNVREICSKEGIGLHKDKLPSIDFYTQHLAVSNAYESIYYFDFMRPCSYNFIKYFSTCE